MFCSPIQHISLELQSQCDCERTLELITCELSSRSESDSGHPDVNSHAFSPPPTLLPPATAAGVPAPATSFLLLATLERAHKLAHHWGQMNGCANAAAHMRATQAATLVLATDAIGLVLRDLEVASQSITDTLISSSLPSSPYRQQRSAPDRVGPRNSMTGHNVYDSTSLPAAWVGDLELEHHERMIVIQEATKHAIVRLAAMLQDVEEEAAAAAAIRATGTMAGSSDVGYFELPDHRRTKELITQLFRLLGTVNKIGSVDSEMSQVL